MKVLVFINLLSGVADGSIYDFMRVFARAEDEIVLRYAGEGSNFDELLSDTAEFDAVVACGGDGTVASVLYATRNSGTPVLPFPAGTANLLTMNLRSPTEAPALAKLLREGKHLDFDLCEFECENYKRGYTIMAGCGYDATIMHMAAQNKKTLGAFAYFHAAFANPTPQCSQFTLWLDGKKVECKGVGVLCMNFSMIQGEISLARKDNSPRDGLLDVLVLATDTAWNLLPAFVGASLDKSGKAQESSNVLTYYQASEVRIEADPALMMQYDGEPLEAWTPLTCRILPSAATIIVSDECYEHFTEDK